MNGTAIKLVERLAGRFPALEPLLREHRADNFGDVLPHVFFGDLTRFVVGHYRLVRESGDFEGPEGAELRALLDELEHAFASGDDEVCELITVSFLENLPRLGEENEGVRGQLGPTLTSELGRIG